MKRRSRIRHLEFLSRFRRKIAVRVWGPTHESAIARLDNEQENLLSAHRWIDGATGAADEGLRLVSALKSYWINRGLLGLGYRVAVEALARIDTQRRDYVRCRGLFDAGQLCCFMGRYEEAQGYLNKVSLLPGKSETKHDRVRAPTVGMAAVGLGDLTKARTYSEEAVALARELGSRRDLAVALISLAQLHRMEGQLDVAELLYREALSLIRELGDQEATAIGLLNLAMVSIGQARGEQAQSMLAEALSIAKQIGSRHVGQSAIEVAASLCVLYEAWDNAARFFGAAEAQAERAGLRRDAVDNAFLAPLMAKTRSALTMSVYNVMANEGHQLQYDEALKLSTPG